MTSTDAARGTPTADGDPTVPGDPTAGDPTVSGTVLSGSGSGGDLTAGMMLFAVGCAILLQVLIFKVGAGWVLYFYSIPVILLGPLIGRNPDFIGICLFAIVTSSVSCMCDGKLRLKRFALRLPNNILENAMSTRDGNKQRIGAPLFRSRANHSAAVQQPNSTTSEAGLFRFICK